MRPAEDPTDPFFRFQWYLKNTGQNGGKAKLDLNVEAAWAQGVTGKNVTTAIMDDGELPFQCCLHYKFKNPTTQTSLCLVGVSNRGLCK